MSEAEGKLKLARQYLDVAMGHGHPVIVDYAMLRYKRAVDECLEAFPERKEEIEDEVILVADLACRAKAKWSLDENSKALAKWRKEGQQRSLTYAPNFQSVLKRES